ncbi:hypothetical protein [Candidatus Poriferisocius sp.]|uniref:hypothetical protein n=1 Tax=Candidatus Poriferisocius sp. TaxID=3101276 RepID=UPI003B5ACBD3
MTNVVVVDDHILLRLLLDDEPDDLRPTGARIATTGLWYHRLCRALADREVVGSMSRMLNRLDDNAAAGVIASVVRLPPAVELVSLRTLGWSMGALAVGGARLNPLSLEAAAAARYLDAEICLAAADNNVPLLNAAERLGLAVRVVTA